MGATPAYRTGATELVPARGLKPRTIGLKARFDLRGAPPQGSRCIGYSASRLLVAPRTAAAWLYEMAIRATQQDREEIARIVRTAKVYNLTVRDQISAQEAHCPEGLIRVAHAARRWQIYSSFRDL